MSSLIRSIEKSQTLTRGHEGRQRAWPEAIGVEESVSCSPGIPVVESTDSRERKNPATLKMLDVTPTRRSLLQGPMSAILVVVVDVRPEEPA